MPLVDVDGTSGSFVNDNGSTVTFTSVSNETYGTLTFGGVTGPWIGDGDASEIHTHTFSEPVAGVVFSFTALSNTGANNEEISFVIDGVPVDLNTLIASGDATLTATSGGPLITAGGNLGSTSSDARGTLTINVPITTLIIENINISGNAQGAVYSLEADTAPVVIPCFTSGTLIKTKSGERPIEDLTKGDMVLTMDHG